MNSSHAYPRQIRCRILVTAVACCFAPTLAWANPVGPTVAHGQATFNTQGKVLTVTNSPGSIINWQGFSIAAGETTRFVQQNAASAVLNRVIGSEASSILGTLQSNGRVFLINPNGIIFGAGALIDTAGLVASTLNIMDADFLSGKLRFGPNPEAKALSNAGEIRTPAGGRVLLISPEGVTNSGIIHTPQGEVILAAGKSVELTDSANPEVRVEVSAPDAKALNLGKIVSESGKVGIYGSMTVNSGIVSADSAVVGENGRIVFRASRDATLTAGSVTTANGATGGSVEVSSGGTTLVAGQMQAKGSAGAGGEVRLLGEQVGLVGSGSVDVSGERGGGTVLVGGDLLGANPAIRNAQRTYVGAETQIKADAGSAGDGGKVIVWADDSTRSYGSISARGGQNAGNGGFVETSGKVALDVQRGPDVRAPAGRNGTWLLDPNDIEIVAGSERDPNLNSGAPFFAPLADSSRIGVDLINAQLDFGSNVVLTTTSRGTDAGTQQGNITVSAPIVKTATSVPDGAFIGTTSLTLQAHNNIVITPAGSITSTGDPLTVNLIANSDGTGGGGITVGGAVTTRGGSFSASGTDAILVNAPINTLTALGTSGGSVQLTASTGNVGVANTITGGFVSVNGQAGVVVAAPIAAFNSSLNLNSNAGTTTVASNLTSSSSSVSVSGRTGVRVTAGSQIVTGQFGSFSASVTDTGSASALTLESGSQVTTRGVTLTADNMDLQGSVEVNGGNVTLRQNTGGRAMNLGTETTSALSLTQAEFDRFSNVSSLTLGNNSTGAVTIAGPTVETDAIPIQIQSGTSITQNAGLSVAGPLTMTAPAITVAAPLTTTGASNLTFNADTLTVNSTAASSGNIDINTRSFNRPIALGVAAPTGNALELTSAQLNNLSTPTRIKLSTGGPINIAGPIAPSGTSTLSLQSSSNSIAQDTGATVSVSNLALSARTGIAMAQDNQVGTLAANLFCCSAGDINFTNAPNTALNIGVVDFVSGVRVNNSSGMANIRLQADDMNITNIVSVNIGDIKLLPRQAGTTVTIGADTPGTLGLTNTEFSFVLGTRLTVGGDRMNVASPVSLVAAATTLAPYTPGRPVHIVGAKSNPGALEFTPAELGALASGNLILGGPSAGPISVNVPTVIPSTISQFTLHSGDGTDGIFIAANADLTAANTLGLTADTMTLGSTVGSTNGNIAINTHTANRNIVFGDSDGTALDFGSSAVGRLSAPAGTVQFSTASGSISVLDPTTFSSAHVTGVALDAGNAVTVDLYGSLAVGTTSPPANPLSIRAPTIDLQGPVAASGAVTLTGNSVAISAGVTAGGDINVKPRDIRSIDLGGADSGSNLGLSQSELTLLGPGGLLRIGDITGNTRDINMSTPITLSANRSLSLKTGDGRVTQTGGALSMPGGNLAIEASEVITFTQPNIVAKVALQGGENVSFTRATGSNLTVGDVDNLSGAIAGTFESSPLTLTADRVDLDLSNQNLTLRGSNVTLLPHANADIDVGTKPAGIAFGITQAEMDRIHAGRLTLGTGTSGAITVSQPIDVSTFYDLTLLTGSGRPVTIGAGGTLTVPGDILISGGSLTTSAALTSTFGSITLTANNVALGDMVTSGGGAINIRPVTSGTQISLGGADILSTVSVLGLDSTDLGNLAYGTGTLTIGSTAAGDLMIPHVGTLAGNVELITGGDAGFSANNFGTAGKLGITANSMSIAGAELTAGTGVSITAASAGRSITLGTKPTTGLDLDTAELAKIKTGTGPLAFDTSGALTTTAALSFTSDVPHVTLSAATLNHTGGALAASGNIVLRADSMPSAGFSTISSTGGGRITVAPRTFRTMNLGTVSGSALGLTSTQIAALSTSGVIQFGDMERTGTMTISTPLTLPGSASALALLTDGNINQSAGAIVTAPQLRIGTGGSANLTEVNAIGTVAGMSDSNFNLTSSGNLTAGVVDGQTGIAAFGNITLRSDGINLAESVNGNVVTLAPRLAGAAVDLGGDSSFGLTNAEVNRVSASTLVVGTSGTNPTGSITVTAPIDRTSGDDLTLLTGAGGTINVNAALGSSNAGSITVTATSGTANINAPLHSSSFVSVTGDTITTSQAITSDDSSVSLSAGTNGSVSIGGAVNGFFGVQVTGRTITVNAPVTAGYDFSSVTFGASSGAVGSSVTINQQVTAGNSISITTDSLAINAPLVTRNSSMTLQPRTAGMPISLGTETAGAFSLSTSELALLSVEDLTVGNTNSGPLTINAPITSTTLQRLNLRANGDITQLPTAPIVLSYAVVDSETGFVQPAAQLDVRSTSGKVELPADNNINFSVTGRASGTGQNFVFNNLSPLKLQNLNTESGYAPTGKLLFNSPAGSLAPAPSSTAAQDLLLDSAIATILESQNTQDKADKDAKAEKEDENKKEKEEQKKEGKKSCS